MNSLNSTTTRSTRPAPKPTRSPRQMATGERLRQISEQADPLYSQLFDALQKGHRATARHTLERMFALRDEYQDVIAAAQDDAGTSSGWSA